MLKSINSALKPPASKLGGSGTNKGFKPLKFFSGNPSTSFCSHELKKFFKQPFKLGSDLLHGGIDASKIEGILMLKWFSQFNFNRKTHQTSQNL